MPDLMPVLMRPWGHMHYLDERPGAAQTVLFVNSLGTDLRMWQGVSGALAARCIGFDMRGHGLSATPAQDWTIADIADDVLALLDHLGIASAVIAGCSVGGMVAQDFGLRHRGRASALVLSNTAAKVGTAESWQARIGAVQAGGMEAVAEAVLDRWFAPDFRASPQALPFATMLRRADPVGYIQTCRALQAADLRAGLGLLDLPVLMIAGAHDLSTPPSLVAETAAMIRGARLTQLPGSGHLPAIDAPQATAAAIAGFLGTLP